MALNARILRHGRRRPSRVLVDRRHPLRSLGRRVCMHRHSEALLPAADSEGGAALIAADVRQACRPHESGCSCGATCSRSAQCHRRRGACLPSTTMRSTVITKATARAAMTDSRTPRSRVNPKASTPTTTQPHPRGRQDRFAFQWNWSVSTSGSFAIDQGYVARLAPPRTLHRGPRFGDRMEESSRDNSAGV